MTALSATATGHTTSSGVAAARPHLFAPWYLAYALLGIVQLGAAPILLPLAAGHAVNAGLLYSAWSCAGLGAPFLGAWGDRHGRARTLLIGGLALAAASLLAFPALSSPSARIAAAFVAGLGTMSANIVANMFIVGSAPEREWEGRIGMLQACMSAGQVAGLIFAGLLSPWPHLAWRAAAACLLLALPIAWASAPRPASVARREVKAPPAIGGEAATAHRFHHISLRGLATLLHLPNGKLRGFLGLWLLSYTATNAMASMLPVAVTRQYGHPAVDASGAYALGILLSLPLYPRAGAWEARGSPWIVMRAGLIARTVVLAAIGALGLARGDWVVWTILALFAVTQVLWPLLSVASNTLSVTLSPADRGESVGLLNAASSLGAALGGVAGGAIMQRAGYSGLCAAGFLCVGGAVLLLGRVARPRSPGA